MLYYEKFYILPQKDIGINVMFFQKGKISTSDSKNDWEELKLKGVMARGKRNKNGNEGNRSREESFVTLKTYGPFKSK